jgi:quinol monooxygenase YgiN
MIQAVYILKTDKKSAKNLFDLLNTVVHRGKLSPGCKQADIWYNKDHSECMLFETWRTMTDLENHIHSPLYKWVLAAIEMSTGEPVIRFAECENIRGIEMVEEVMTNVNKS